MLYTVYKTTNKTNGKIYIGVHKTNELDDDYLGSGLLIGRAIEKYGVENFEKEILAVFEKASDMFEMESEIVNKLFVDRNDTYNIKEGGHGGWDYLNDSGLNMKNHDYDEMAKLGAKASNIKQKWLRENDQEWVEKIKNINHNKMKKFYANGGKNAFKGKKHSETFKKRLSKIMSESQSGSGNSQFGKMWIYNLSLKESKRIDKTEEIPDGWLKGRKIKFS